MAAGTPVFGIAGAGGLRPVGVVPKVPGLDLISKSSKMAFVHRNAGHMIPSQKQRTVLGKLAFNDSDPMLVQVIAVVNIRHECQAVLIACPSESFVDVSQVVQLRFVVPTKSSDRFRVRERELVIIHHGQMGVAKFVEPLEKASAAFDGLLIAFV